MGEKTDLRNIFREYLGREDATDPNRVWSDAEIDDFIKQRQEGLNELNKATESAEERMIRKKLEASEEAYKANEPARKARKAKEAAMQAERLPMEEWKKQYPQHLVDNAEDMTKDSRSMNYIDDLVKKSNVQKVRADKLKSLAKGVGSFGSNLVKGAALDMALRPSDIAVSELPNTQEGLDKLEGEMRMKNAPYNYPTRFNELRKKLGR